MITDDVLGGAQRLADRIQQRTGMPITVEDLPDSPHCWKPVVY
jgi:hypothetical protein